MKLAITITTFIALAGSLVAGQTFKGHHIGETAEEFFSIWTTTRGGFVASTYCKDYLMDPKVLKAYDRAQSHIADFKAMQASADVKDCSAVQAALAGEDAVISSNLAVELSSGQFGSGSATFHAHKLVILSFVLTDAPYDDILADMEKKLQSSPVMTVKTSQNGFGATLNERRAEWTVGGLNVVLGEIISFQHGYLGTSVTVADSGFVKQRATKREAERPNTLD